MRYRTLAATGLICLGTLSAPSFAQVPLALRWPLRQRAHALSSAVPTRIFWKTA
jgi:hypothetical protein